MFLYEQFTNTSARQSPVMWIYIIIQKKSKPYRIIIVSRYDASDKIMIWYYTNMYVDYVLEMDGVLIYF